MVSDPDYTLETLTPVMEGFGLEASLITQRETLAAFPKGFCPPSVTHADGLRETGLRNIRGGAIWQNDEWVASNTDEGVYQITNTIQANRNYLMAIPGCPNGSFYPDMADWHTGKVNALTDGHNPTLSAGLQWTLWQMESDRQQAEAAGVKSGDLLRFVVASHNAGFEGALEGYEAGDVDKLTTYGNYSAWVLRNALVVEAWIAARPKWQYHPNN